MATAPRLALVGAGAFSDFCLKSYRRYLPGLTVVAIFDTNTKLAAEFAVSHHIPVIARSMDELLAVPSDAVVILTPPNTHFELGRMSVAAGKNTLIEKPIAFSLEQASELITLAEQNQCRIAANLVLRYHPFHLAIRELVESGRYGALQSIATTAHLAAYPDDHWYWQPAVSGGFFLNTYTHFFDLYRFISGQTVTSGSSDDTETGHKITIELGSVSAQLTTNLHARNEDELVTTTYRLERATITTRGWFPEQIIVAPDADRPNEQLENLPKEERYGQVLSHVLGELLSPPDKPLLTHQDLLETVRVACLLESTTTSA